MNDNVKETGLNSVNDRPLIPLHCVSDGFYSVCFSILSVNVGQRVRLRDKFRDSSILLSQQLPKGGNHGFRTLFRFVVIILDINGCSQVA